MAVESGAGGNRLWRVFTSRHYAPYAIGNGVSLIGTWAHRLATGWLVWELTESGTWLGLVVFADLASTLVIAPLAGAMADRWNKLTILRICQIFGFALALALAGLVAAGAINIWAILAVTLLMGIAEAFAHPARLALVHALVPDKDVSAAIAANAIVFNLARFIGPALAGSLILTAGIAFAFLVNALTFLFFFVLLSAIRVQAPEPRRTQSRILADIVDGLRYSVSERTIAISLALVIAASILARPVIELLPGFAATVFNAGPGGLAAMTASVAAGALAGGIWLGSLTSDKRLVTIAGVSACALAASVLAFTLTDMFWIGLPILVLVGVFNVGTFIASQTLIQLNCRPDMRGRVLSLYGMIFRGAPAAGALCVGIASELWGFRLPMAVAAIVLAGLAAWLWRDLRASVIADKNETETA